MQLLCLALRFFVSKCNLCFDTIATRKLSMDAFLTAADNALRTPVSYTHLTLPTKRIV